MRREMRPWLAVAIGLAAILSAIGAGAQAIGNALGARAPSLAHSLSHASPEPMIRLARANVRVPEDAAGIEDLDFSAAQAPARAALERSLLAPLPLAVLAWDAPPEERRRILAAAERINKRDSLLQAALLREYEVVGNSAALMATANNMMRVHPSSIARIAPTLVEMLADDSLVPEFADLLAQEPPWIDQFLIAASRQPELAENLADLRLSLVGRAQISSQVDRTLITNLVGREKLPEALAVYRASDGSAQRRAGDGPALSIDWANEYPPFDWNLANEYEAYMRPREGGGVNVRVLPGQNLELGVRLLELPDSAAGIRVVHDIGPQERLENVSIEAVCVESGDTLAARSFARSPFELSFDDNAAACTAIRLEIAARTWSTGGRIEGAITSLDFIPGPA